MVDNVVKVCFRLVFASESVILIFYCFWCAGEGCVVAHCGRSDGFIKSGNVVCFAFC